MKQISVNEFQLRVVIAGSPASGKSTLVESYQTSNFTRSDYVPTIGVNEIKTVRVDFKNASIINEIWDVAGQMEFRELAYDIFNFADLLFIVFDVTREDTMQDALNILKEAKMLCPYLPISVVANKKDLVEGTILNLFGLKDIINGDPLINLHLISAKYNDGVDNLFIDSLYNAFRLLKKIPLCNCYRFGACPRTNLLKYENGVSYHVNSAH